MPGFAVTGCFGKLPARGDFLLRGLPRGFADPWHDWLANGIHGSRAALGDGWLPAYLNAPIWRFALQPGVCGTQPAAGVLMASVDKAGRHFPLTIVALLTGGARVDEESGWFDAVEELAFTALALDLDVEGFVRDVAALVPALSVDDSTGGAGAAARWWTLGGEGVAAQSLVTDGLPDPVAFGGFLTGFPQPAGEGLTP
ncbi:type VI secretion system-associated protein TagF [Azospirillum doebereinerae]